MSRLRNAAVVLQLLSAHPELASRPLNWEIDDRPILFPKAPHGDPANAETATLLASVLGIEVEVSPVNDVYMHGVHGEFAGVEINLYAFVAEAGDES